MLARGFAGEGGWSFIGRGVEVRHQELEGG
jgi:hypothetical protein